MPPLGSGILNFGIVPVPLKVTRPQAINRFLSIYHNSAAGFGIECSVPAATIPLNAPSSVKSSNGDLEKFVPILKVDNVYFESSLLFGRRHVRTSFVRPRNGSITNLRQNHQGEVEQCLTLKL
jgi:hypothetical protein